MEAPAVRYYRDEEGYPGRAQQFNVALQHQFPAPCRPRSPTLASAAAISRTALNMNQLGLEHINRAANDTTVCSLTGNVIIPQGQPGYTSTQRDTCYGAYLRQLVPNPFVGLIREGALSTATVQRALLLVQFPEYSSANRPGYSGESRYNALQFRADKRLGAGGLLSANYTFSRNYGNVETITNWLDPGCRLPDEQPRAGNGAQQLRCPAQSRRQLCRRFAVRSRQALRWRNQRIDQGADQRLDAERRHDTAVRIPARIYGHPNLTGSGYDLRPNVDPNCDKEVSGSAVDRLDRWFNTACFSVPNAGFVAADASTDPSLRWKLGNATRTDPDLRARASTTGTWLSPRRRGLAPRMNLTFRVEAFNLFNRVQFGPPNTQASTAPNNTFGRVTTQVNQPRLMQLACRLTF